MKTIQHIYNEYYIMPSLQLHMLRVSGVVKTICDHWLGSHIDFNGTIKAALLHDMGNILKADFSLYPDFLEPEGLAYRQDKKDWTRQFGDNECEATMNIVKHLGVSGKIYSLLDTLVMNPLQFSASSESIPLKILDYADMSVSPHGVPGYESRIADIRPRIIRNMGLTEEQADNQLDEYRKQVSIIESQIMPYCSISPTEILSIMQTYDLDSLRSIIIIE